MLAYFGTYTRGASKGIYCYKLDLATGKLTSVGVTEGIKNPSSGLAAGKDRPERAPWWQGIAVVVVLALLRLLVWWRLRTRRGGSREAGNW